MGDVFWGARSLSRIEQCKRQKKSIMLFVVRKVWEVTIIYFLQLIEGYHMDPPQGSPQEIKVIMLECWNHDHELRPSLTQLLDRLKAARKRLIAQGM